MCLCQQEHENYPKKYKLFYQCFQYLKLQKINKNMMPAFQERDLLSQRINHLNIGNPSQMKMN